MTNGELINVLVLNTLIGASAGIFRMTRQENLGKQFTVSGNGSPLPENPQPVEKKKRFLSAYGIFPGICGGAYGALLAGYFGHTQIPPYLTQVIIAFIVGYIGHIIVDVLDGIFADKILQKLNRRSDNPQSPGPA